MVDVVILRGLPGSGKRRFIRDVLRRECQPVLEFKTHSLDKTVKKPKKKLVVLSMDHYFDDNGTLVYSEDDVPLAMKSCFGRFKYELESNQENNRDSLIVVSNPNMKVWEMAPYVALAGLYGIDPRIVFLYAKPEDCVRKNGYGMTMADIFYMWESFELKVPWDQDVRKWG